MWTPATCLLEGRLVSTWRLLVSQRSKQGSVQPISDQHAVHRQGALMCAQAHTLWQPGHFSCSHVQHEHELRAEQTLLAQQAHSPLLRLSSTVE